MFISKKKWNDLQDRVSALEKTSKQNGITLERAKEAVKTALSDAEYRFEYELTENQGAGPAVLFSSSPKQDIGINSFFTELEKFCKGKQGSEERCHNCELLNFCYSPPSDFKKNCDIDKVIDFVNGLKD